MSEKIVIENENIFIKNVKHTGATSGDKYTDGRALYLLVNAVGKYWRMDYRFVDKRKTLALGVYPDVGLAKARLRRDKAREQLADGIDPAVAKREEKQEQADAAANTFEAVARIWLTKTAAKRAEVTMLMAATSGSPWRAWTARQRAAASAAPARSPA
jgi:hypothetical protein